MQPVSDEQVVKLLPALAEAARADKYTAARFVPPRIGVLEETASRRHQFVFGRRGVGKSTLLRKIESQAPTEGHGDVIFVDVETLRGRPYPDVLIELLIELLDSLENRLKTKAGRIGLGWSRRKSRRELRRLKETMRRLLNEPQVARRIIRQLQSSATSKAVGFRADGKVKRISGRGRADHSREKSREEMREAEVEESKMDGLTSAAVLIRSTLEDAQKHLNEGATLIVLDDFYHVPYDAQPEVLAYLHQIVKNLGIFLKICGVRHRIQPFVDADPPRGLQPGQDAGEVSLDITLERFTTAQTFLERILSGISKPLGITLEDVITEGGRRRLVLGSGGVARDYLNLTQQALRIANERDANPTRLRNRIGAEDVNEAAAAMSAQKQEDLRRDASTDADKLRERLADIVKFSLDVNKTNVLLVEGPKLQEEDWGKEIQALADLRLLHEFGNLSDKRGTHRGRRFVGFTLDLSNYTGTRSEQITQIEFWTREGKQAARNANLIYVPGASERPAKKPDKQPTEEQAALDSAEWGEQTDIYSLLGEDASVTPASEPSL